jgi:hypothetical protein
MTTRDEFSDTDWWDETPGERIGILTGLFSSADK